MQSGAVALSFDGNTLIFMHAWRYFPHLLVGHDFLQRIRTDGSLDDLFSKCLVKMKEGIIK